MTLPILLAHGALGPYDEIILPVIGGAFIGLIIVTWWTSRNKTLPDDPKTENTDPSQNDAADHTSHYKLD